MTITTHYITLEELGIADNKTVEAEVTAECYEAEPMVRYDRNGTGHPGCPPHADLLEVKALKFEMEGQTVLRGQKADDDWKFDLLDEMLWNLIDEEKEEAAALEAASEYYER